MKTIRSHKLMSTVIAVCIAASAIAVGIGVALGSHANAQTPAVVIDPRIGDYDKAQRDLEQHLDQRLRVHLAQAARRAGK